MKLHIADRELVWYEDLVVDPIPERVAAARMILDGIVIGVGLGKILINPVPGFPLATMYASPAYVCPGMTPDQDKLLHWCAKYCIKVHSKSLLAFTFDVSKPSTIRKTLVRRINFLCTARRNGDLDVRFCFPRL